jgi:hypothetical protein
MIEYLPFQVARWSAVGAWSKRLTLSVKLQSLSSNLRFHWSLSNFLVRTNIVPPPTGEDRERTDDARRAARVCSLGDSTDCEEAALPEEASQVSEGMEGTDTQAQQRRRPQGEGQVAQSLCLRSRGLKLSSIECDLYDSVCLKLL